MHLIHLCSGGIGAQSSFGEVGGGGGAPWLRWLDEDCAPVGDLAKRDLCTPDPSARSLVHVPWCTDPCARAEPNKVHSGGWVHHPLLHLLLLLAEIGGAVGRRWAMVCAQALGAVA